MNPERPHITVCVCTFRRPELLTRLLETLERQETGGEFTYSVVICDNDPGGSALDTVMSFQRTSSLNVHYTSEPRQNIALARNEALRHATGDFIAFVDDDEFVEPEWLRAMWLTCEGLEAAGALDREGRFLRTPRVPDRPHDGLGGVPNRQRPFPAGAGE